MDLLKDKTALITGSGRGIGKATALVFAQNGANVVVNDLDEDVAMQTAADVEKLGVGAAVCAGDVTAEDFPERFLKTALENFGEIDILVNNAGFTWDAMIHKMTDEMWDAILNVHLKAPFRILREFGKYLRQKSDTEKPLKFRKVVNVTSVAGLGGNIGQANYASAKSGVVGLTKTLAKEWGRYNVTVNAVAFGAIETRLTMEKEGSETADIHGIKIPIGIPKNVRDMFTKMIPLGRIGRPEEAANSILYLASPLSSYVSGHVLECTGGLRF